MKALALIPFGALLIGAAPSDTIERHVAEPAFDAVAIDGAAKLVIVQGPRREVQLAGTREALDALILTVRDGTLHIDRKRGAAEAPAATVTVTEPAIKAVAIKGSGTVRSNVLREPEFAVAIHGSGDVRIARAALGHGKFSIDGSGNVALDTITAHDLAVAISGSGKVTAAGSAETLAVTLSGTGEVDTSALDARNATLSSNGAGSIHARASADATIQLGGSGRIVVEGHPRCTVAGNARRVRCG
jgi:hypothetical protein